MKSIIVFAFVAIVSTSVSADGFAPWNESRIDAKSDTEQAVVPNGSYYRDGKPSRVDVPSVNQAEVSVKAWYAQSRV